MKSLETILFGVNLLLLPALAWWLGRLIGRRDWRITGVMVAAGLITLLPNLLRFALLAAVDVRSFPVAFEDQIRRAAESVEVGLFLLALGVFMTMLGWTSTPVAAK